jgi:hypothetical protein
MIIVVFFLLVCVFLGLYLKSKFLLYLSLACGLATIFYCIYHIFFCNIQPISFSFSDDARFIADGKIDIYCGDDLLLPDSYDEFGSLNACLKKGIGIGMGSSDSVISKIISKPPKLQTAHTYCGTRTELPQGYDRFATRNECLRKGVGVGARMPLEKRQNFKSKSPRGMSKHEIYELAHRFKIPTNQPRIQVLEQISNSIF